MYLWLEKKRTNLLKTGKVNKESAPLVISECIDVEVKEIIIYALKLMEKMSKNRPFFLSLLFLLPHNLLLISFNVPPFVS